MKNLSLGLAQSSSDIQYYEKLIKSGKNIEIISIHPYATYYIEKNTLPYKIIEDYFSEEEKNILYSISLKESNQIVDNIDTFIYSISKDKSLRISNSEYIDADLINPILIKIKILQNLKQQLNFNKILICKNSKKKKKRDNMLFYSYSSWFDISKEFSLKHNILFNTFISKYDNFDYPYSFFEKNRELLKSIIPNFLLMKKFTENKVNFQRSTNKSTKQTILFLERVGPLEVLFNELVKSGYRVLYYDAQKSVYEPKKIYIYDSDINDYISLDYNYKAVKNKFITYYNKFSNSKEINQVLNSNIINLNLKKILKNKLNQMFFNEIWHSFLVSNQFNIIVNNFKIDLTISLETYKTFINSIVEKNIIKHLVLFHGPRYTLNNAKYSVYKAIKRIEYLFVDGIEQENLYSQLLQKDISQVYITGNSIYSSKFKQNKIFKYDILYMTTKLDPAEIIFHTDFSNNLYIRDSLKIIDYLNSFNYKSTIKFKPMAANIGLDELPFFSQLNQTNIDIYNNEISSQELMNISKIVLLDSLGTSLLQALSLNKIVILFNPYKYAISDRLLPLFENSTYYCTTIKKLLSILKNTNNLKQKDTKILLDAFAKTDKEKEIIDEYSIAIKDIFND